MSGHLACHLVAVLHAWRCPTGHGASVFVRVGVDHGRLVLRVIGLVA